MSPTPPPSSPRFARCFRVSVGNTGGLGGIFGPLVAIGKPLPFPEAKPYKMSKRYRFFNKLGQFLSYLKKRKEASA